MASKFVETKYIKPYGNRVKTPFGYQTIEYVYKTIALDCLKITHSHGDIVVANDHAFIINDEEILASSLEPGDFLWHELGPAEIYKIESIGKRELYDISLDQSEFENQWYYSDGILSHNSGKSITVACYLAWLFNFTRQINMGIVANRAAQAREFLKNTKDIFSRLPLWMACGVTEWNKSSIGNELETRILTDSPTSDAFRGYSIHCISPASKIITEGKYNNIENTTIGELYEQLKAGN